jgi:hypothetical protein
VGSIGYRGRGNERLAAPGIIVSDQIQDLAELIRRVRLHLDSIDPSTQKNQVLKLCA